MQNIEVGKPFVLRNTGEELAKVLTYYGCLPDTQSAESKIVCPFHQDVNPSMIINLHTGTFFCFGCNCSGDAFHFVELANPKLNSLKSMLRYLKILKSRKVKNLQFDHKKIFKRHKPSKELYDISWDYYYGLSNIDWVRDMSKEVSQTRDYMLKRGFSYETLNKCQAKITYNNSYPIIFPMLDNGMFKGWVCRTTNPEIEKKRKYLYNEGFSRRDTLVGDYEGCDYVFVVEGYMDRLKFIQFGITNVVAILGWKMSREQENKLKKANVNYIISALDNDTCGIKGTKYLKTIFRNVIRFKYLKGIKDPGEMSQKLFDKMYNETMRELIKQKHNVKRRK